VTQLFLSLSLGNWSSEETRNVQARFRPEVVCLPVWVFVKVKPSTVRSLLKSATSHIENLIGCVQFNVTATAMVNDVGMDRSSIGALVEMRQETDGDFGIDWEAAILCAVKAFSTEGSR
jgi:hypothetical protein